MNPLKSIWHYVADYLDKNLPVDRKVKYSVKKYNKTYELLEKYDEKADEDPNKVAEPERLAPYIRELQKGAGNPR